jgi:hypothetical protein
MPVNLAPQEAEIGKIKIQGETHPPSQLIKAGLGDALLPSQL